MSIELVLFVVGTLAFIEGLSIVVFPKGTKDLFSNIKRNKKIGLIEMLIAIGILVAALLV